MVSLPYVLTLLACTLQGGPERVHNPGRLCGNFVYRRWNANVYILKQVQTSLLRCTNCVIHMTAARLQRQKNTDRCDRSANMRLRQRDMQLAQRSGYMQFSIYGRELDALMKLVTQFKYMVIPMDQSNDAWPAIIRNIRRARKVWFWLVKILQQEGADAHVSEMFNCSVVHAVLLGYDNYS